MVAFIGMMSANAQKDVTSVATDGGLVFGKYVTIWGTTADTLKNADTLNYVMRIKGAEVFNIRTQLYNDRVSGTASGKLYTYSSIDGVNYTLGDSITVTSITSDALDSEVITFSNVMHPYIKFKYIQSGTAVTVPKLYFVTRKN